MEGHAVRRRLSADKRRTFKLHAQNRCLIRVTSLALRVTHKTMSCLEELPEAYRLVPLPLDEPEVAQKALLWAHEAPNEGWPLVYALFLGGKPLRLLLPEREISLGVSQAA